MLLFTSLSSNTLDFYIVTYVFTGWRSFCLLGRTNEGRALMYFPCILLIYYLQAKNIKLTFWHSLCRSLPHTSAQFKSFRINHKKWHIWPDPNFIRIFYVALRRHTKHVFLLYFLNMYVSQIIVDLVDSLFYCNSDNTFCEYRLNGCCRVFFSSPLSINKCQKSD